jgi:cytidylate kinase
MTQTSQRPARRIVIAIDGPGGAGKTTVAKQLARRLGYTLLDSGALYRAVALLARRQGISWSDEVRLAVLASGLEVRFDFDGEDNRVLVGEEDVSQAIRTPEISDGASQVSVLPRVRAALLDLQRRLGRRGGVVAEGRDMGTVIFPQAEVKFFLTADPAVRARRRHQELLAGGSEVGLESTASSLAARDERDSQRQVAPLARAADAVEIDSSGLELEQVIDVMLRVVRDAAARTAGD